MDGPQQSTCTWERLGRALADVAAHVHPDAPVEIIIDRVLRGCLDALPHAEGACLVEQRDGTVWRYQRHRDQETEVQEPQVLATGNQHPFQPWPDEGIQATETEGVTRVLEDLPTGDANCLVAGLPATTARGRPGYLVVWGWFFEPDEYEALETMAAHAAHSLHAAALCRRFAQEARTDGLTGAFNYRHFMDSLWREIRRAGRFRETFAVVMVDVDNLKEYNDRFGHLGGSAALKAIAEILLRNARDIDIIAKYGGDEFSVLLPNTSIDGALAFAQRMRVEVQAHQFEGDAARALTISIGIAAYPEDGMDARGLLNRADARLYRAKADGKNRVGRPTVETTTEDVDR